MTRPAIRLASQVALAGILAASAARAEPSPTNASPGAAVLPEVVVTASRIDLLGRAQTASEGVVTREALALRPTFRVGQVYEAVPGLVVTSHSGEGKANQYLMRGFNLDHGTDFASFVDGMPVNRPTNAHGQGYSDQNFLAPQIAAAIGYAKGPYSAANGDFSAVGAARVRLTDELSDQMSLSAGTLRDFEGYVGGTHAFGATDRVWAMVDATHADGPWSPPGNFNKVNLTARYSHGDDADGYSLTAMAYSGAGRMETDQSVYAVRSGMIGRYGALDPTDASRSQRYSLSARFSASREALAFASNAYVVHSTMTLYNDFTHYLFDDVEGDQEEQDERRDTVGADAVVRFTHAFGPIRTETVFGVQDRFDSVSVDRRHTHDRTPLPYCELDASDLAGDPGLQAAPAGTPAAAGATPYLAVGGRCSSDHVRLNDLGVYVETTVRWTGWLRNIVGFRGEDYAASDHSVTTGLRGSGSQTLAQPKASLVLGPWSATELYLSAGRGFHSNDAREVFLTVPYEGPNPELRPSLLSSATGEEVGLRTSLVPKLQVQVAAFQEDFSSEQLYDQDQGEDQASAPTRRQGVEVSAEYQPARWIELNMDLDFARARYRDSLADLAQRFGLDGVYVANAPGFTGSLGVLIDHLGPWFGGLEMRSLGAYPVADGDKHPQDKGYDEVNLEAGYRLSARTTAQLAVFNLLGARANAAAYDYASRLTPSGVEVTGLQVHPLEPISARLTLTERF